MNHTNSQNAEKALKITTLLILIVAGYEVLCSCQNYQTGMNLLDIASYANANLKVYCLVLILANLILLPSAILLYKQSGISLKQEIFDKSTLSKDITRCFSIPGTFCMDEGLFGYSESIVTWETLEETNLMFFEIQEIKDLIYENNQLKNVYIILLENALRYKIYRENGFLVENATQRYIHFKKLYPMICETVKQHYVVTYLGIAPESLSRIKKALKEE